MILEIAQVKRFLAKKHNLPLENSNNDLLVRVLGEVPDGEHTIPLGVSLIPTKVRVLNGAIKID